MNTKQVNFKTVGVLPLIENSDETFFHYEIENLKLDGIISELSHLSLTQKIDFIYMKGGAITFCEMECKLFKNNLILVDSCLPEILGAIILYSYKKDNLTLLSLLNEIENLNPLRIPGLKNIKFYTYTVRGLLQHLILGMKPSAVWFGEPNIYDYYPIIQHENQIIYYSTNVNIFIDTILENTLLTRPNSCEKEYENIYFKNGKWYLKLSLGLIFKQ